MKHLILGLSFLLTCGSAVASSQQTLSEAEKSPLIIDSRDGLKCDRVNQVCTAKGKVVLRKGPYTIYSKKAVAYMRKNTEGKNEIRRVEIFDDVKFFGPLGESAASDEAVYDLDDQIIQLIPDANKQVTVWKDDYILIANTLDIHFTPSGAGRPEITHIDALGNVSLSSPIEMVTGDSAKFTPNTNLVIVTGDVRLNREEGQLRGSYAEVNIDTKLSKVLKRAENDTDERVRVFVYPEKAKSSQLAKPSNKR